MRADFGRCRGSRFSGEALLNPAEAEPVRQGLDLPKLDLNSLPPEPSREMQPEFADA